MKAKLISVLISTAILGATASISNAQTPFISPANIQIENGVPSISGIEFSEEQKEKLKELLAEARSRRSEILTSEEQDSLQAAIMETGTNPREVMKSLNLSREEKKKLRSIQKWQREEFSNILTEEQKEKLMKIRQRKRGGANSNFIPD